jgi:ribonuclease BN (tRNA processing enzyme)
MRLTFLGTGSAMPTGERHQSGLLVESGDDRVLVDCGSGVLHRLAETDVGYEGIDTVLLTHHHIDHVADLMPLLKAKWLAGSESLALLGPPGTRDLLDGLLAVHAYMQDRLDLSVREVEPGSFDLGGFAVEAMETRHSMTCHAYRFAAAGDDDGELTISGDTEAFADLAAFADGSDILVHDCSFPDDVDVSNHPTPALLGETLSGHEFGTVYLTHLYPHTRGRHGEMLDSIASEYDGEVTFARDGLTVET